MVMRAVKQVQIYKWMGDSYQRSRLLYTPFSLCKWNLCSHLEAAGHQTCDKPAASNLRRVLQRRATCWSSLCTLIKSTRANNTRLIQNKYTHSCWRQTVLGKSLPRKWVCLQVLIHIKWRPRFSRCRNPLIMLLYCLRHTHEYEVFLTQQPVFKDALRSHCNIMCTYAAQTTS